MYFRLNNSQDVIKTTENLKSIEKGTYRVSLSDKPCPIISIGYFGQEGPDRIYYATEKERDEDFEQLASCLVGKIKFSKIKNKEEINEIIFPEEREYGKEKD